MQDPQVKLKKGIVRVNLDSRMSQVVLVLAHGIKRMILWPVVLYAGNKCMNPLYG